MSRFVFWEAPREALCAAAPLYADLAGLRMQWALVKLARKAGYNPAQPRIPDGSGRASGRWGGGSFWKNYPRKIAKNRPVIAAIPKDAVTCHAPDGTTFPAPPGADFQQVYAAGQSIHTIPVSQQFAYIDANVGQDGLFDFQRTPGAIYARYADASNYAVGVFMNGAGYTKTDMDIAGSMYALFKSQRGITGGRLRWWNYGYEAAASGQFSRH